MRWGKAVSLSTCKTSNSKASACATSGLTAGLSPNPGDVGDQNAGDPEPGRDRIRIPGQGGLKALHRLTSVDGTGQALLPGSTSHDHIPRCHD